MFVFSKRSALHRKMERDFKAGRPEEACERLRAYAIERGKEPIDIVLKCPKKVRAALLNSEATFSMLSGTAAPVGEASRPRGYGGWASAPVRSRSFSSVSSGGWTPPATSSRTAAPTPVPLSSAAASKPPPIPRAIVEENSSVLNDPRWRSLSGRLLNLARALSGDSRLRVQAGNAWEFDGPSHTLTVPAEELCTQSEDVALGAACAWMGRVNFATPPSGCEATSPFYRFLWSAIEDGRAAQILKAKLPGTEPLLQAFYGSLLQGTFSALAGQPNEEALCCILALLQEGTGAASSPAVGGAASYVADSLRPALRGILDAPMTPELKTREWSPEEVLEKSEAARQVVDSDIWPVVKALLDEDVRDGEKNRPASSSAGAAVGSIKSTRSVSSFDEEGSDADSAAESLESGEGEPGEAVAGDNTDAGETDGKGKDAKASSGKEAKGKGKESGKGKSTAEDGTPSGKVGGEGLEKLRRFWESAQKPEPSSDLEGTSMSDALRRKGTVGYAGQTDDVDLEKRMEELNEQLSQVRAKAPETRYEQLAAVRQPEIDEMVSELRNALMRDEMPQLQGYFDSGDVYDLEAGIQAKLRQRATGHRTRDVFLRADEPKETSTEIIFCVDISGSMNGPNISAAREAFVVFQEALEQLDIRSATIAYNEDAFVLNNLGQHDAGAKDYALRNLQAGGGNNEPAAMDLAKGMFEASNATNKVILMLTDGGAVGDCKEHVERLEKETGIKVIGIGIGGGCGEVPHIYSRHLVVPSVAKLPQEMSRVLESAVLDRAL